MITQSGRAHLRGMLIPLTFLVLLVGGWWAIRQAGPELPPIDRHGLHRSVEIRLDELVEQLAASPTEASSWGELAILLDLHQQPAAAITCYRKAMEIDPADARWPYLAGICASLGDTDQALLFFEMAAMTMQHAPLPIRQGQLHLGRGEVDLARDLFEQGVQLDATLIQGHLGLARCALASGDPAEAASHLDRCEQLQPSAGEVASARAIWWRLQGDMERAASSLEEAADKLPREPLPDGVRQDAVNSQGVGPRWRRERSQRWLVSGRTDQARALWQQAISDDPTDATANLELAHIAQLQNDYPLAQASYTRAAELDPDLAAAHAGLGVLQMRGQSFEAAEKSFRRALDLDPESAQVRANLGSLLVATARGAEGLQLLTDACERLPEDTDLRFNLAMAYRKLEQWPESSDQFSVLLDLDPDRTRARFEWGVVLAQLQRFSAAADQFKIVLESEPGRASVWMNLTRAQVREQLYGDALASLRSAHAAVPGDWRIASELAWLLATCPDERWRDGSEARQLAAILCQKQGPTYPRSLDVWGASLAECGEYDAAIEKLLLAKKYLDEHPELPRDPELDERLAGYRSGTPYRFDR
ncbi:MAG: tetratricopeptide repeat protein [Planctomycetota bacterium]|nr:tetratricopeptide repeat protein [Planctomycetota bacterium]